MRTHILGCDPGATGALAWYDPECPQDLRVFSTPHLIVQQGGRNLKKINAPELAAYVEMIAPLIRVAWVEEVHSSPEQGVVSVFSFGEAFGILQGILAAFSIPVQTVRPEMWKRRMGVTSDKDTSRQKADLLFPEHRAQWKLKKHHDRAEAALLAAYGSMQK